MNVLKSIVLILSIVSSAYVAAGCKYDAEVGVLKLDVAGSELSVRNYLDDYKVIESCRGTLASYIPSSKDSNELSAKHVMDNYQSALLPVYEALYNQYDLIDTDKVSVANKAKKLVEIDRAVADLFQVLMSINEFRSSSVKVLSFKYDSVTSDLKSCISSLSVSPLPTAVELAVCELKVEGIISGADSIDIKKIKLNELISYQSKIAKEINKVAKSDKYLEFINGSSVRNFELARTSTKESATKNKNVKELKANVLNGLKELTSINQTLVELIGQVYVMVDDTVKQSEIAKLCTKPLQVQNDILKLSEYKTVINEYIEACSGALDKAIGANNEDSLAAIRKTIESSITNLSRSVSGVTGLQGIKKIREEKPEMLKDIVGFGTYAGTKLEEMAVLLDDKAQLPLTAHWRTDPLTLQFYAGLEASDVEGFNENANPRAGMLVYFRPGKKLPFAREITQNCHKINQRYCGVKLSFIPHWYFKADYSSAAEQSDSDANSGEVDTGGEPLPEESAGSVDTSLEWETGMYWPIYYGARAGEEHGKINPLKTEYFVGLLYARGGRKINDSNTFSNRYYRGIRLAFNEETYFDLLQGYSEGLNGLDGQPAKRWELRAQKPVSKFGLGRLFIGGSINVGHKDSDLPNKSDSYKLYLVWQTSFDDLWSGSAKD